MQRPDGEGAALPAHGRYAARHVGRGDDPRPRRPARSTSPCSGGRSPASTPSSPTRRSIVVPLLKEEGGSRMVFRITMGVRPSDQEWKRELNRLIAENQDGDQRDPARLRRAAARREQPSARAMIRRLARGFCARSSLASRSCRNGAGARRAIAWRSTARPCPRRWPARASSRPKRAELCGGRAMRSSSTCCRIAAEARASRGHGLAGAPRFDIPGSRSGCPMSATARSRRRWRPGIATISRRSPRATRSRTLVIYCKADCWMSWNAAKRAVSWGFRHRLVSRRDRRLGSGKTAAGRAPA